MAARKAAGDIAAASSVLEIRNSRGGCARSDGSNGGARAKLMSRPEDVTRLPTE